MSIKRIRFYFTNRAAARRVRAYIRDGQKEATR